MCALASSLKRSSRSLLQGCELQRVNSQTRQFSNLLRASSSTIPEESNRRNDSNKGLTLLRSVSGLVLASSLGFWFWSSSPLSYADWSSVSLKGEEAEADQTRKGRKPRFLFDDSYRRRVFFNYEKRIRTQSPPEKVFDYFASHKNSDGELFMTPADLMRAVVPVFPPTDSNVVREGYLRGERYPGDLHCAPSKFFMLFDTNNDGLISFPEYIFFVTLLSIPEESFSVAFKMFDLDHNGEIDQDEFKKVMALMRSFNRQGACHRNGMRPGLKVQKTVENGGLVEYLFREGGKLQYENFVQFLKDLHNEMLLLEFSHYDYKSRGTISARDFALTMVAAADMNQINRLLDRVDEISDNRHLQDIRFTFEEFKAFADLRKRLKPLALAIFGFGKVNGLLTKKDFQRAVSHVCGIDLDNNVIDVVFHVFDADNDGNLSSEEFLYVLQKRERDMAHPTGSGLASLVSCCWTCTKTCSPRQWFH